MGDLSRLHGILCCNHNCSMSIFILSNNDYLNNLSASTAKDHDCFQSPSTSSKNLYISISRCILSVTASRIIQFSSNSDISGNVEIVVIGCGQIVQHGWFNTLIISAPSHFLIHPFLCHNLRGFVRSHRSGIE